jgi:hypothetical protein
MAKIANYHGDWRTHQHMCAKCDWVGQGNALRIGELFAELTEFDCPACGHTLLLVQHPTLEQSRANWDKLDDEERSEVEAIERVREQFQREKLRSTDDLPEISTPTFVLNWDFSDDGVCSRTLITLGDQVIFSEPAVFEGYERFAEVARVLKAKYGSQLRDVIPTEHSYLYLYGDKLSAPDLVRDVRRTLFAVID